MNDITIIIAVVSAVLLVAYFICVLRGNRSKPDLIEAISLILTSGGIVTAVKLGYLAVFEASLFIGELSDQRIPMLAGAFAILWVSIDVTWKIYTEHLQYENKTVAGNT